MHALVKKNPPASLRLNLDTNPRSLSLISDLLPPYFCLSVIAKIFAEFMKAFRFSGFFCQKYV